MGGSLSRAEKHMDDDELREADKDVNLFLTTDKLNSFFSERETLT